MSLDQTLEIKKSRVSISLSKGLHPEQSKLKSIANLSQSQRATSRLKVRRQSFGFTRVPGIRPVERTSQAGLEFKRPPLLYLPTYRLDPVLPFNVAKVKEVTDEVLDQLFTGHVYNVNSSPTLALRIAGEIMRKVKNMQFSRYRVITVVTLGQKRSQSYNNAILFLWDHERDKYVDVQREMASNLHPKQIGGKNCAINHHGKNTCGIKILLGNPAALYEPLYKLSLKSHFVHQTNSNINLRSDLGLCGMCGFTGSSLT